MNNEIDKAATRIMTLLYVLSLLLLMFATIIACIEGFRHQETLQAIQKCTEAK